MKNFKTILMTIIALIAFTAFVVYAENPPPKTSAADDKTAITLQSHEQI